MSKPKLAVIVGSNRRDSINRKLANGIAKLAEGQFEIKFVQIDDLPIFNQDHESDPLPPVVRFRNEIKAADAYLFVTPEHNRSIPTVLKNAIDWGSRPYGQSSWAGGKPGFVTGTSGGAIGTAMAQETLRTMLNFLGVYTMPAEAYITFKPELIDDSGKIAIEDTAKFLQGFIDRFATFTAQTLSKQKTAA